jgi:hypothetical protein
MVGLLNDTNSRVQRFVLFPGINRQGMHRFGVDSAWLREGTFLPNISAFCTLVRATAERLSQQGLTTRSN